MRLRLLAQFDSPENVFRASSGELQSVQGVGAKLAQAIVQARTEIDVDAQIKLARDNCVAIYHESHSDYPPLLREIDDPPGVLFARGELQAVDRLSIAIVGTRHATHYGKQQASRLATSLAQAGITVVSGLARGIDTAAHQAALAAGGRTIAVLANGVLKPYPPENAELAKRISAQGCVLGESPPTMPPVSGMFPQRNRIISGISLEMPTVLYKVSSRHQRIGTPALAQSFSPQRSPGRSAPQCCSEPPWPHLRGPISERHPIATPGLLCVSRPPVGSGVFSAMQAHLQQCLDHGQAEQVSVRRCEPPNRLPSAADRQPGQSVCLAA